MNLLAVYKKPGLPSSRIRIVQMVPYLEALGVTCTAVPYPSRRRDLRELLRDAAGCDLVWLQKKLPGLLDYLFWRRLPVPLFFDYDDAIVFRQTPRGGSYRWPRRERRFRRIVGRAAGVTCGNRYLAALAAPAQQNAFVYPSPVPVGVAVHRYEETQGEPRLGWVGDAGNLRTLRAIAPQLEVLARERRFSITVISSEPVDLPGLDVRFVPWSLEEQEREIAKLDVGLMPLQGASPYDRGKCSYKVLQYMAAGVAPVAQAVGMNTEVIQDAENGRLVGSSEDWLPVLREVLTLGRAGLAAMGQAGLRTVREGFSYEANARRVAEFFAANLRPPRHSRREFSDRFVGRQRGLS